MHYVTRRHVALGLTTGGLLVTGLGMSTAQADSSATASGDAAGSPGVGSGNVLQIPINLPVNVCGNQVDVLGILDSVTGNTCANGGSPAAGGSGSPVSGSTASGSSHGSPGVGSGNLIQVPVNAPVNICGNQLDVIGVGDHDRGNSCANGGNDNNGSGGGASASGSGAHSPGIVAGNVIQMPINLPVNVCGNQLDVIGFLDSVTGNSCANGAPGGPQSPQTPTPVSTPPSDTPPTPPSPSPSTGSAGSPSNSPTPRPHHHGRPSTQAFGGTLVNADSGPGAGSSSSGGLLAHTGTGALAFAPVGAGLFSGGVLLKRRLPKRRH